VLLGLWLLPGISLVTVIVIACIVVPIDFAAAPSMMRDWQIPGRVSDLLNVEAGYGDGIISPTFVFALAVADIHVQAVTPWEALSAAVPHAAKAVLIGLCIDGGLALAPNVAERKGLMTEQSKRIIAVAAPALAYTLSLGVNANGFIAAFLCGIGYHYLLTAATQR
jgi:NhaP-type Na+/H+ or K+/H+ antiporter